MADESSARNWKDTILLPKTEFSMRAGLAKREPEALEKWEAAGLYERARDARSTDNSFVFHDGPPYANGNIHHGHALNKVLKDIVVKYNWMRGFHAPNIPGWDCHGLPIEQKVDEELGEKKAELSEVEFRQQCRAYANKHVGIQREQFKRLMVLADWKAPYLTMDYAFEATTMRELGRLMEAGFVYKGLKPVHWSWKAQTSLAEAEVEYDVYKAPSVYVKFELKTGPSWLFDAAGDRKVHVVIWTTTPWTLPANLAIALNPELEYQLLALSDDEAIVLAEGLREEVQEKCGLGELDVLTSFEGHKFVGNGPGDSTKYVAQHPFIDRESVLLPADYVTLEQGTGNVHTAPGHGADDFVLGKTYQLDVLAPVDERGHYTDEVADYAGMHVFKANKLIAQRLKDSGHLLNEPGDKQRVDRYPHCWRTKTPLIFRATPQWFVNVDHNGLREKAIAAVGDTRWVPAWGENRIRGMLETRPDWNISRQRAWGVPITAFECRSCGDAILDHEVAYHVARLVEEEGADAWFSRPIDELVPEGFECPHCGAGLEKLDKVRDILDVWFDSGTSWAAVLRDREGLEGVADLYLEGSDQHRGWFHTSLLVSVANQNKAPYKNVLTHGFVVDDKGHKFSKSSPNYEPLEKMVNQYGAEILRLWVATVDYRGEIGLSHDLLKQVSGSYRKIRNTFRFLLGNLGGYDANAHEIDADQLTPIDRWALRKTAEFVKASRQAYEDYEFHTVFHLILNFCGQTLSAVYLDVLKDRMYCDGENSAVRRGSTAVIYEALRSLLAVAYPILTFTTEEVWTLAPLADADPEFLALSEFPAVEPAWLKLDIADFEADLELRDRVLARIEELRPAKRGEKKPGQIGSSQEAAVTLKSAGEALKRLTGREQELAELFIVSSVTIEEGVGSDSDDSENVSISIEPATGEKCPRCWHIRDDVGSVEAYPELCGRCGSVVAELDA